MDSDASLVIQIWATARVFSILACSRAARHLWQVHAVGYSVSMLHSAPGNTFRPSRTCRSPRGRGTRGRYREWHCGFVRPRTNRCPFGTTIYVTMGKPEIMDWMSSLTVRPCGSHGALQSLFNALVRRLTEPLFPRGVYREASRLPVTLFTAGSMFIEIGNKLFITQLPRRRDFVINARGNEQPARAVTSAVF